LLRIMLWHKSIIRQDVDDSLGKGIALRLTLECKPTATVLTYDESGHTFKCV